VPARHDPTTKTRQVCHACGLRLPNLRWPLALALICLSGDNAVTSFAQQPVDPSPQALAAVTYPKAAIAGFVETADGSTVRVTMNGDRSLTEGTTIKVLAPSTDDVLTPAMEVARLRVTAVNGDTCEAVVTRLSEGARPAPGMAVVSCEDGFAQDPAYDRRPEPTDLTLQPGAPATGPHASSEGSDAGSRETVQQGEIVPIGHEVELPRALVQIPPVFPPLARTRVYRAKVHLRALVGIDGRVEQIRIDKASPPGLGFEQAAQEAVLMWQFSPATLHGVRVRVWVPVHLRFDR
jgi:TonB family protein